MAAVPPDPFLAILKHKLLTEGRTVGLRPSPLVVLEIEEERWESEHLRWDEYERAARELFGEADGWPNLINCVIATERLCSQAMRSRRDEKMLARLTRLLGLDSNETTLKFAELFLHFLTATRPTVAA